MAGVMASALTGAMSSLLPKLAALLEKKYKLSRGAKKEIASLREEMSSMNALLLKLARAQQLDEQERDWRDKVRELSYDMEDCIDNFTGELDSGGGDGLLSALKKLRARYSVTVRIQELKARAVETSDRHDRYSCKLDETPQGLVAVDPRVQALHTEADRLVGMDGPKKKLIELLGTEEEVQQLKVIVVVGSGGIGKTTLANQVYSAMKSQFECRAFVSVSQNPNMAKVLSDIYYGIRGQMPCVMDDACRLIDELKGHLQSKRYLIVIDDLWTTEAWNIIRCSFVENNQGSRVITTTRLEDVAREICPFHGHVYKIKPLNDVNSRRLFHRRIFYTEDACPDELKHVSDEILRKCGGMPLAILSMASILANHEEVNSKEIWEKVKNRLGLHLEGNYTVEWVRHVLNLGYNDLPVDLKTCMLYLGIFPEDAEIRKDDLLKRWIAEGIVTEVQGDDPEVIAESYFCKLINRNMIQIAEFDDCGHIRSCRVHDLMLEFIILKSAEENFLTVINDLYRRLGSLAVRRLSIQVGNSECNLSLENMVLTQVRSFSFWGPVHSMPSLSKFQLLRVLHIDACESEVKQDHHDLSSTCTFFQLRYLRIRGIDCEKMLKQLRKSQHLQTLEIVDSNIMHLFRLDVRKLPLSLQHLIVPETVQLIGGISRLSALRTLGIRLYFNDVENIEGLGELDNLRELKLCYPSGIRGNIAHYFLACMSKLGVHSLRSLTINGGFSDDDVLTYWSPPPCHLQRLHMVDLRFSIVPDWIIQLHMLKSLEVQVVSLSRHGVEVLNGLTLLVHLGLIIDNDVPEEGIILSGTSFMNLKEFSFKHNLPCLTFEAGTMPRLERLLIECQDPGAQQDDGAILTGIEHLGSLEVFKVDIYIYGNDMIGSYLDLLQPSQLVNSEDMACVAPYFANSRQLFFDPCFHTADAIGQLPSEGWSFANTQAALQMPSEGWSFSNSVEAALQLPSEGWNFANTLEAALRKAISRHPGSPDIYIQSLPGRAEDLKRKGEPGRLSDNMGKRARGY